MLAATTFDDEPDDCGSDAERVDEDAGVEFGALVEAAAAAAAAAVETAVRPARVVVVAVGFVVVVVVVVGAAFAG